MTITIRHGDCREVLQTLPDESVHCCVTSPPYFGLRDYGVDGQIGLEETPEAFVDELVAVFREVRRVLRSDGTLWLNLGDSYAGSWGAQGRQGPSGQMADRSIVSARQIEAHPKRTRTGSMRRFRAGNPDKNGGNSNRDGLGKVIGMKPKDLIGVPWSVAFALRADGWYLRQDIIWHKPNPMPESITDRCTKSHEYLFLFSKSARYAYDGEAIKEPAIFPEGSGNTKPYEVSGQRHGTNANLGGNVHKIGPKETRNKRSVWTVPTTPFADAHFATFPPDLIEPCIKAGCLEGGTVLDPFGGAGTTGLVADRLRRDAILIELNPEYAAMAERRIRGDAGMFAEVAADAEDIGAQLRDGAERFLDAFAGKPPSP